MAVAGDDAAEFPAIERDYIHHLGSADFDWCRFASPSPRRCLRRPLAEARIGLLSTAGAHLLGEGPIGPDGPPRVVPVDAEVTFHHVGYDTGGAKAGPEVVWPVGTLRSLAEEGVIGELSERAVSMMGAVLDGRVVTERHVPVAVEQFRRDDVDLVLLVPA
ncbi:MAG: glycine/sarcosine/betaine reductase selenoprotein B family protein [Acidimicrobiales bacterium]